MMRTESALCDRGPGCDGHCRDREIALGAEISRHRQALDAHYPLVRSLLESGRYTHGATPCRTLKQLIERYGGARGGKDFFLAPLWERLDGEEVARAVIPRTPPPNGPTRGRGYAPPRGAVAKRVPGFTQWSLIYTKTASAARDQGRYRRITLKEVIDLAVREFNHNHPIPPKASLGIDDPNAPEETGG
jgi:hypothetical protein